MTGGQSFRITIKCAIYSTLYFRINFVGPQALERPTGAAGSERGNEEEGEINVSAGGLQWTGRNARNSKKNLLPSGVLPRYRGALSSNNLIEIKVEFICTLFDSSETIVIINYEFRHLRIYR